MDKKQYTIIGTYLSNDTRSETITKLEEAVIL